MIDGSDAIADWPLLNALVNTASGASWVSIHHGGGVGIGRSIHAGQVTVADGTALAGQNSSGCCPTTRPWASCATLTPVTKRRRVANEGPSRSPWAGRPAMSRPGGGRAQATPVSHLPAMSSVYPRGMTPAQVLAVARQGARSSWRPGDRGHGRFRRFVEALAAGPDPVYGVSTGFGALATRHIDQAPGQAPAEPAALTCGGHGQPVDTEVTRGLMFLRLSTLATGRTGVRPVVAGPWPPC